MSESADKSIDHTKELLDSSIQKRKMNLQKRLLLDEYFQTQVLLHSPQKMNLWRH